MGVDPWTAGAVMSTLNDATLQHDNAELGYHPHREWLYSTWGGWQSPILLLFVILGRFAADHGFDILSIVFPLLLCILAVLHLGGILWDERLKKSRLERSIAVQQQALQEEFDGAVVMSLEGRIVWLEFRAVDANQTLITAMPIV
jgi:hypothetical protein